MSLEEAQAAIDEIEQEVSNVRATLTHAQGAVRGLELRVGDGDTTVSAVALVEGRHQVEVLERRLARLSERHNEARDALSLAEAYRLADDWEAKAPALRGAIRDAALRLVAARDEIEALVAEHNSAAESTRRSLLGVKGGGGRFRVSVFGPSRAGNEALRALHAEAIVAASLARRNIERFPPDLPRDVLPFPEPAAPLIRQRQGAHPDPDVVQLGASNGVVTEEAAESAIRSGHARRSPFVRLKKEII